MLDWTRFEDSYQVLKIYVDIMVSARYDGSEV